MEMPEATYVKGFIQVDFPDPLHHRGRPPDEPSAAAAAVAAAAAAAAAAAISHRRLNKRNFNWLFSRVGLSWDKTV